MNNIDRNTILSSFNEKCTLLQWLKNVDSKISNFRSGTKFVVQEETPDVVNFILEDLWLKPSTGELYKLELITGGYSPHEWNMVCRFNMVV
jgi:hypothetical protein